MGIRAGGGRKMPPLESARMKLQRNVRGQNRGSWICPVQTISSWLTCIFHEVFPEEQEPLQTQG